MKVVASLMLLLAGHAMAVTKYVSGQRKRAMRDAMNRQAAEVSPSLHASIGTALQGAIDNFEIPSAVDDSVLSRFENRDNIGCEGDNCQAGVIDLTPLFGYACWCFFGNIGSTYGRGPPLDGYDAICQRLVLCYRCIFVDSDNEGEDCDPFTVVFDATLQVSGALGISNMTTSCQQNNVENCSWRTCTCAMTMMTSFLNLSFNPNENYDPNLRHDNGFDYNIECEVQGRALDRQCCGFYPFRRTYDRGEARQCCHERTIYNPLRHICCDNGLHTGLGHNC